MNTELKKTAGNGWVSEKPTNDHQFAMVTANKINSTWDYNFWEVIMLCSEDGCYHALCNLDGDEWGDYEDLTADLYYILPLPPKP